MRHSRLKKKMKRDEVKVKYFMIRAGNTSKQLQKELNALMKKLDLKPSDIAA